MDQSRFQNSRLYYATTLRERLKSLHSNQTTLLNGKVNVKQAQRRLERWQSQKPFAQGDYFAQRLAMDGLTEEQLLHLLGERIETVANRFLYHPTWLTTLFETFCQPGSVKGQIPLPEHWRNQAGAEFFVLIEPLINHFRTRLNEGIQALANKHTDLPFTLDAIEEVILNNLPDQLIDIVNRTMVLELRVASLQGVLVGDTPEERFKSFIQSLCQHDTALTLFQEYPVLARQLILCLETWSSVHLEIMQRLCEDWDIIRHTFCPDKNPGVLVELDSSVGDKHRGGRSVTIVTFSSSFKLVYKPKPLAVELHFQKLITWINERGNHPSFRTLKIIDRDTYGWVEFVSHQGCTSVEELQHFYERQGGYLALLYMLRATDFHFENVIAAGEHPVLVDLESLLHPDIKEISTEERDLVGDNIISNSVLRVGLLPQRIWENEESEGIDLSGLGTMPDQLSPRPAPYWAEAGTDQMHLARQRMAMSEGINRPKLNGAEVSTLNYTQQIITGFTSIYDLLLKSRDELLSEDGPLARLAEDEVRVLLRPTMVYTLMLRESFHPDFLRDGLDRDRFFDKLWTKINEFPDLTKVIQAEQIELNRGDIPLFTTYPNSRDIWTGSGERIVDFFAESGLTLVQRHLQQFSEDDLEQQIWFIRASLTALSMGTGDQSAQIPSYQITEPRSGVTYKRLVRTASTIGNRLEELTLRDGDKISWLGLKVVHNRYWAVSPLEIDLYSGLPGVVLFLAHLSAVTGQERYTALAQAAFTSMAHQIEHNKSSLTAIGGLEGWGGIIYTLAHLGVLWDRQDFLVEAQELVTLIPKLIEKDKQLDIIGGTAGCIAGLVSLYDCMPSEKILQVAIQCGDHLLNQAKRMGHGLGWITTFESDEPLTGFSHGAAGIASALLELATLTGEVRFHEAGLEGITYERSLFYPEASNWPDLRHLDGINQATDENEAQFMSTWCHGAPGIGLARLRSLPYLDDAEIREEIDTAIQTTLRHGFGMNHSLCHGSLGNLELLLQASLTFDNLELKKRTYRIAAGILNSMEEHGWQSGVPMGVETPGLMTGLAGIGYQLLRLAAPERVPSVLTLEPPRL